MIDLYRWKTRDVMIFMAKTTASSVLFTAFILTLFTQYTDES